MLGVDWLGSMRSRSAISSSNGSRQRAIGTSSQRGKDVRARSQGPPLLQPGHNALRGLGRLLADGLDDGLLELLDHAEVDQGAGDRQLQAELLADFAGQLEDDVNQDGAIGPVLTGL